MWGSTNMSAINHQIPGDMVVEICRNLQLGDQASLSATCKDFHQYIESAWVFSGKHYLSFYKYDFQDWTKKQILQIPWGLLHLDDEIIAKLATHSSIIKSWTLKELEELPQHLDHFLNNVRPITKETLSTIRQEIRSPFDKKVEIFLLENDVHPKYAKLSGLSVNLLSMVFQLMALLYFISDFM